MPFDFASFVLPLWWLLVLYGLFLSVFAVYSLFNLYNLLRFGTTGHGLFTVIAVFAGGTVLLTGLTFLALAPYDWSVGISLSSLFHQGGGRQFFPGT